MWISHSYASVIRGPDLEAGFYRQLAENSLGLICCHDLEGVLLWINSAAANALGYVPEEGIGTRLDTYLAPEVRPLFASYLARIRDRGVDSGLMRLRTKDGGQRIWMYRNILSDEPALPPHVLGHALDITEQFRAQQALRNLFQQAPVGYIDIDPHARVRRVNRVACQLLGYSEQELLAENGPAGIRDLLGACATSGNLPRLTKFVRNDGRTAFLEVHARCIFESDSFAGGRVCALVDATDRVQAEMKIRNLQAQLEARVASRTAELRRSNAELQEFAYVASHDLQAPLKQVRSVLEQLALTSNDPEAAELLCRSQQDANRMLMLIDGLLSYAVASNPAGTPSPQVPLVVALEESLMILASLIASSGATVAYEDLPSSLVDESAFVQLFQNLVGNAIKYRGPEAPRVRISATRDNNFWTIAVEDNGIGIDPAYSEQIFKAFRRLHGKDYAGSGIGLATCKKIVERIGGQIWVESQSGRGSTFRFTVPVGARNRGPDQR